VTTRRLCPERLTDDSRRILASASIEAGRPLERPGSSEAVAESVRSFVNAHDCRAPWTMPRRGTGPSGGGLAPHGDVAGVGRSHGPTKPGSFSQTGPAR